MSRNKVRPKRVPQFYNDGRPAEKRMTDFIQDLVEFEDFKETILPAIRKDVKSGMTAKQLREKYAALAQARLITDALMNPDAGKAAVAAKDIIDRAEGKAVERKETTHRFENMSDQELDALLASEEEDLAQMEDRFEQ